MGERARTPVSPPAVASLPMPPGPALLHDPAAEALLSARGWVVIPYLTGDEVAEVVDGYFALHPDGGSGFDTDFAYLDLGHKRAVERTVRPTLLSHLDEHFIDGEVFNGTFVVKWPDGDSVLPVHQDWSYVDERRARSVSLWIALEDIGPAQGNGSLGLLSGSHRLPCEPRGATSLGWYRPWSDTITQALEHVEVRAGEALVFDNRILHGSAANTTDRPRLAIASMVGRADEPLLYFDRTPDAWLVHPVTSSFFVEHSPISLRTGHDVTEPVSEVRPVAPFAPPLDELAELCAIDPAQLRSAAAPDDHRLGGVPLPVPADRATVPVETVAAGRAAGELLERAGQAWTELDHHTGIRLEDVVHHWGEGRFVPVPAPTTADGPAVRALRRSLDQLGVVDAGFAVLDPGFELPPREELLADGTVAVIPVQTPRPLGSVMFQAGAEVAMVQPGELIFLDPGCSHVAWNRGPIACVVLIARLDPAPSWRVRRRRRSLRG